MGRELSRLMPGTFLNHGLDHWLDLHHSPLEELPDSPLQTYNHLLAEDSTLKQTSSPLLLELCSHRAVQSAIGRSRPTPRPRLPAAPRPAAASGVNNLFGGPGVRIQTPEFNIQY